MPTRDSIVQAADALFYERGFEHTSFADIADAVRISRGNFYYHCKTKDEILTAADEVEDAKRDLRSVLMAVRVDGAGDRVVVGRDASLSISEVAVAGGGTIADLCANASRDTATSHPSVCRSTTLPAEARKHRRPRDRI